MVYLLVIVLLSPGVSFEGGPPTEYVLTGSPEEAAIELWSKNHYAGMNQSYTGALYEINLQEMSCIEVDIPLMTFE